MIGVLLDEAERLLRLVRHQLDVAQGDIVAVNVATMRLAWANAAVRALTELEATS
jgi:hypothetical protein